MTFDLSDPLTDDAIGNLMRIRADTMRWRKGWADLAELAKSWAGDLPVGILMLDIDHSARIRAEGIGAKIELVSACRRRMAAALPDDAVVIDSGTRDETCIVLPGAATDFTLDVAERLRCETAARPFVLRCLSDEQSITLSCGVGTGCTSEIADVTESARTGLNWAKQTRDSAVLGKPSWTIWTVNVPSALVTQAHDAGIDVTHPSYDALDDVLMEHTGIRHWLVDRGIHNPMSRLDTVTWRDWVDGAFGTRDDYFYRLLDASARSASNSERPLADLHEQRFGTARVSVAATLSSSIAETLRSKVISKSTTSVDDVISEALRLDMSRSRSAAAELSGGGEAR